MSEFSIKVNPLTSNLLDNTQQNNKKKSISFCCMIVLAIVFIIVIMTAFGIWYYYFNKDNQITNNLRIIGISCEDKTTHLKLQTNNMNFENFFALPHHDGCISGIYPSIYASTNNNFTTILKSQSGSQHVLYTIKVKDKKPTFVDIPNDNNLWLYGLTYFDKPNVVIGTNANHTTNILNIGLWDVTIGGQYQIIGSVDLPGRIYYNNEGVWSDDRYYVTFINHTLGGRFERNLLIFNTKNYTNQYIKLDMSPNVDFTRLLNYKDSLISWCFNKDGINLCSINKNTFEVKINNFKFDDLYNIYGNAVIIGDDLYTMIYFVRVDNAFWVKVNLKSLSYKYLDKSQITHAASVVYL